MSAGDAVNNRRGIIMIPVDNLSQDAPPLSRDFAERVMRQANLIIARRRRRRRLAARASLSVLAILMIFGLWSLTLGLPIFDQTARLRPFDLHAGINTEVTSSSNEEEQAGLRSFFFPDADAVARLADRGFFGDRDILSNESTELDADNVSSDTALVSFDEVEFSR